MSNPYKDWSVEKIHNLYKFSRLLDSLIKNREKIFYPVKYRGTSTKTVMDEAGYIYFMEKLIDSMKQLDLYYEEEEDNGINY